MSRDRPSLGTAGTSRRRFLRGVAGFSLGAVSLGAVSACQRGTARPAQKRLPLIGVFHPDVTEGTRLLNEAMVQGLAALGYREGQTIHIEHRNGDGDQNRWPDIARDLVSLHPDVIVMTGIGALPSMLSQTRTIPIVVMFPAPGVEDMIRGGFIKSQAHPGGSVTGLVGGANTTLVAKQLDLLHEAVPGATRLATLRFASFPDTYQPYPSWASQVVSLSVSGPEGFDDAFARFEQEHAELLIFNPFSADATDWSAQIAEQTRRHRLPAICGWDVFPANGGLMSYSADKTALYRGVGHFVDKILKGAKPADLPVELPTAFNFTINKGTANALGLTIPPAVLAQATEVLQ